MELLTENALLTCAHETGKVMIVATQSLVTIQRNLRVLVQPDPEGKSIVGCNNFVPNMGVKPCTASLVVQEGYSGLVRINGRPVCLKSVTGFTDGTPPGTHKYAVRHPGQSLVSEG